MPAEDIGAKTERIVIQYPVEAADFEGQPIKNWIDLVSGTWAAFEFLAGRELEAMQKINTEINAKFRTSLRRDVTTKMRIQWKGPASAAVESWNIHQVQPADDKFDMYLMVSKVQ